jgi:hypothetical protein
MQGGVPRVLRPFLFGKRPTPAVSIERLHDHSLEASSFNLHAVRNSLGAPEVVINLFARSHSLLQFFQQEIAFLAHFLPMPVPKAYQKRDLAERNLALL